MTKKNDDVDLRKRIQELEKENLELAARNNVLEERFMKIFRENLAVMLMIDAADGRIIDANLAAVKFYGWEYDVLTQKKVYELNTLPPEEVNKELGNARLHNQNYFRFKHRIADGSVKDIEVYSTKVFSQGKDILHSIIHDVTQRSRTEMELMLSEEKYRKIFENTQDVFYQADLTGIIIDISPSAKKYSGYTRQELIGKNIGQLYVNDEERRMFLQELLQKGEVNDFELTFRSSDGKSIVSSVYSHIIFDEKHNPLYIEGSVRDITLRKKLVSELEELNSAKDKFFSIIAHDLRSPFHGLMGLSNLLSEKIDTLSKEQIKEFADVMTDSLDRQYSFLSDLLDWARLQNNRFHHAPEKLYLRKETEQVIQALEHSAVHKNISLNIIVDEKLTVFADAQMLALVLRNLLTNAIKFTKRDGEVSVSAVKEGDKIRIEVADSGIGMTKEDIDRLFRIDSHISTEGTEGEAGTGLGLLLCKEMIEKQGGTISVQSKVGKGSKFIFMLPAYEE